MVQCFNYFVLINTFFVFKFSASAGTEAKLKSCEMELEKAYAKIRELESLCADQKESIENLQVS